MQASELREHADMLLSAIQLAPPSHRGSLTAAAAYLRACADALDAGPVAWRIRIPGESELGHWFGEVPLGEMYTNEPLYPVAMPQALRLPEPMTDERVRSIIDSHFCHDTTTLELIRAVEAEVIRRVKKANK